VNPPVSRIRVRDVRAYGRHGSAPGERERPQPFDVDIELDVDLERARRTDALEDTVDYARVCRRVVEIVAASSFALLERLGDEIVRDVMLDERVRSARVTISKPRLLDGATPSVSVAATRAER
jgi:dihydroneopterin aldolase